MATNGAVKPGFDLWGGTADPKTGRPWNRDTVVNVFSTTKGMASMAVLHAASAGLFDLDDGVADHWPEFAANGKERVTIRQLLAHQAGLCAIDRRLRAHDLADPDRVASALAEQAPAWEPGIRHGYHGISRGWYESELIRRTDPEHRTIGRYFNDEIAELLGLDFWIGLPDSVPEARIARVLGDWYRVPHPSLLDRPHVQQPGHAGQAGPLQRSGHAQVGVTSSRGRDSNSAHRWHSGHRGPAARSGSPIRSESSVSPM